MIERGLLMRMQMCPERHMQTEQFLQSARATADAEPGTTAWFAVRFGAGEYGLFDVFEDETAREAHLQGRLVRELKDREGDLFRPEPQLEHLEVLASKLPEEGQQPAIEKGILVTFKAKTGENQRVEDFLRDAQAIAEQEEKTTAWFALRLPGDKYGIFDVFPDNAARMGHLVGRIPRGLAKQGAFLLGGVPEIRMLDVLAAKMPGFRSDAPTRTAVKHPASGATSPGSWQSPGT